MAYKCEHCKKSKAEAEYMPSTSPFWPSGHINMCYTCIEKTVNIDDLNAVDRLLQFANIAFIPQEWRKISKREGKGAFKKYGNVYHEFNYYKYDWGEQNEQLMDLAKHGLIEEQLEELKPALLAKLKKTWGYDVVDEDLLWLENYYNSILADYNVDAETQRDQFRKICLMSLAIDKNLKHGEVDKDLMTQYNNFMKSALDNVEKAQSNSITSISQIVEFMERNGYRANFYDDIPRDEVDMIITNIKEYIADLVRTETNMPELVAQAKQRYSVLEAAEAKAEKEDISPEVEEVDEEDNADQYFDHDVDLDEED